MCAREAICAPSMLRLIRRTVTLARMWPTLELRAAFRKQRGGNGPACVCRACSTPEAAKKRSPMSLQKQMALKLTVKTARGASNSRHERSRMRGTVIVVTYLASSSFI